MGYTLLDSLSQLCLFATPRESNMFIWSMFFKNFDADFAVYPISIRNIKSLKLISCKETLKF